MTHINAHIQIVKQIAEILKDLTNDAYVQKLNVLDQNSLGQHFRHILEFYLCLLEGLETGIVNYDKRKRDLNIESQLSYALQISELIEQKLGCLEISKPIGLECTLANCTEIIPSSIARELLYLTEHSVHHFALIKIGVKEALPQLMLSKNFGVAESTVVYRQS